MARSTNKDKDVVITTPTVAPAPTLDPDLEKDLENDAANAEGSGDASDGDDSDSDEGLAPDWVVVNTRPAVLTLHGGGAMVVIPSAFLNPDSTVEQEGTATIPGAIVAALYDSTYFRSLFKDGTLRKV